jgi:hypothetical protein
VVLPVSSVSGALIGDRELRQRIADTDLEDDLSRLN